ncbi:MAG: GNAT family N-acetyltransferase [Bacilli bacterium]|jgi:ribosomal-protein-alanine N-acetyltransferase|nr:GNAT family N-acetyltransferase [Bacilli bacterium]
MNLTGTTTLESKRLRLRRIALADANAMFHNWANDDEVTRYLTWNSHASLDVTQEVIRFWIEQYASKSFFHWTIVYCPTHEIIGTISLFAVDVLTKSGEVGYCIGKKYWNNGIMTEALHCVLEFAFQTVGFEEICAKHHMNNLASGRVMQKNHMTKQDDITHLWKKENKNVLLSVYKIRKEDFI